MRRWRWMPVLAAIVAALVAIPAGAYQLFSQTTAVSGVSPNRWQSLPLNVKVDSGPTNILGEIQTAFTAWNAVPTAKDPWGTASAAGVDYAADNFGTDWGGLSGDGQYEVAYDEDGSALRQLGLAPESVNGFGPEDTLVKNGQAVIDDMFLIINGHPTVPFDRQSTEVHELGHTLGLAHSTVGFAADKDSALSPPLDSQVPTMHPFAVTGTDRRTLEADDMAALSELYPEPAFAFDTGTLKGRVTRCDTGVPVLGANVRIIKTDDPRVQLTRVTGFDGGPEGSYEIRGVPPGDYFVVVEPLAGDAQFIGTLTMFSPVETGFTQEYFNQPKEADCAQDSDPDERTSVSLPGGGTETVDLKVDAPGLALVIDVTGSMGPELGAIKVGLNTMVDGLAAASDDFPKTAIVTFRDDSSLRLVSSDPARLHQVIDSLTTSSTADCPEASNRALMTAGRQLSDGGRAILVTDADSHPTGPTRADVDQLFAEKGIRLTTLLSGSCPPTPAPRALTAAPAVAPTVGGTTPDQSRPLSQLGREPSLRTFSEESLFSGGLLSFQPGIKGGTADAVARYANTLANVGISAVRPAVAAVSPAVLPQGTALTVELTGSNTGFRAGSTVAVAASGVTGTAARVLSPTRIDVDLSVAGGAATGFRDVTVTTNRGDGSLETARAIGAVQVTAAPTVPAILSITPSTGAVGQTLDVAIAGGLTHFAPGSTAFFGDGVTVTGVTVSSATSAVAHIRIEPGAKVDFRAVTVTSGAETAGNGSFLVAPATPALPRLTGASPRTATRGSTVEVQLTGADTGFADGTSIASVSGAGVEVLSTRAASPTSAFARVRIAAGAPLGFRDVKLTTGTESAALTDALEITPAPAPGATAAPAAPPGTTHVPTTCTDRARPRASFQRASVKHRKLTAHGRAGDAGCTADISVAGRVARVEVAISRHAGRRCRFAGRTGKLGTARTCSRPVWLKARGTRSWSVALKLPRGTYTVLVRARDGAGNVTAKPARRSVRIR